MVYLKEVEKVKDSVMKQMSASQCQHANLTSAAQAPQHPRLRQQLQQKITMLFVEMFVIHRVKKDYTLSKILAVLMVDCIVIVTCVLMGYVMVYLKDVEKVKDSVMKLISAPLCQNANLTSAAQTSSPSYTRMTPSTQTFQTADCP